MFTTNKIQYKHKLSTFLFLVFATLQFNVPTWKYHWKTTKPDIILKSDLFSEKTNKVIHIRMKSTLHWFTHQRNIVQTTNQEEYKELKLFFVFNACFFYFTSRKNGRSILIIFQFVEKAWKYMCLHTRHYCAHIRCTMYNVHDDEKKRFYILRVLFVCFQFNSENKMDLFL